ncbi:LysE family translocator [Vibrio nitrifigilis]|uniref:LysE family translocator n=1 Tax=Vibrio nitrifigilis TaxID=2789781 RepID=A0ABS0GKF2_9VIBR|nr:LysE family translocator [Vibrio nitrifigilis]MBF9002956.1 LysE family translocator [Vibrio nitrifigilis]
MSFEIWIMFATAYLLVTLSPGPNVILVLKNSIQNGWKSALITILGNLSCQLIIVCLVGIGVGGILAQLPAWFFVMKCVGGLYLIYLGIKSLRSIHSSKIELPEANQKCVRHSLPQLFIQAFLVSASNPKTLIFLSAFLPQFLDISHPHIEQFSVMYLTICVIVTSVHLSYALIISRVGHRLQTKGFDRKLSKITGGLFITMGSGVLLSSRT